MNIYTSDEVLKVMEHKAYKVFRDGSTNLIGVRANETIPNSFNDLLYDLRIIDGKAVMKHYQITTDPGTTNLLKPLCPASGTAILKPGQYLRMWALGRHKGLYPALVQVGPCMVLRDNNLNNTLDFDTLKEETGLFGINCHKAREGIVSKFVNGWSAGCQVHADAVRFEREFIHDMKEMAQKYGNHFTYTLLVEGDF